MTEIIHSGDPRSKDPRMAAAIKAEIRELLAQKTFKIILYQEVPYDANLLTARYVLAIKSKEHGQIKFKARYVIGGPRDILKNNLVHNMITLHPQSVRIMIS